MRHFEFPLSCALSLSKRRRATSMSVCGEERRRESEWVHARVWALDELLLHCRARNPSQHTAY
ncbi:hypothetical protein B0I35DRAFT_419617 [Stachybotrys elegans]|uniref:Uncharacterized protein n=1 Tax=Stachybotrys elegans TaxID=80388 RepID=A0A8K0WWZ8_9HYPO|nr:hypothetical protein B0I35DRAFT_419617 [Stachybotrys elegans]